MGWKAVKDHYRIDHGVQIRDGNICIGSAYIPDIIVIAPDGAILKRWEPNRAAGASLDRYLAEMDADRAKLAELVKAPDVFATSIPVYTWEDGEILECQCEELGWPNVTHDGRMMYENTFDVDRVKIVRCAIASAQSYIRMDLEHIAEIETNFYKARLRLETDRAWLAKYEAEAA